MCGGGGRVSELVQCQRSKVKTTFSINFVESNKGDIWLFLPLLRSIVLGEKIFRTSNSDLCREVT